MESEYVTEVPSSLKQLARLVARGFYSIEDCLIIDMLVRHSCMKEDDICDLLKFEKKMLRGRMSVLKNDKFVQLRLKAETDAEGRTQKFNCYYINYKRFVNVVNYKLDHMRTKIEMQERNATSRACFKCYHCPKTFSDLEVDHLFDPLSGEFRCYLCRMVVVEDEDTVPKTDTKLLARFNEQMEPLYSLLREVEDVKLAPSLLEPEPINISHLQRNSDGKFNSDNWSGEVTRHAGRSCQEMGVDVRIGDPTTKEEQVLKPQPIWMSESTVIAPTAATQVRSESILLPSLLDQIGTSITDERSSHDTNFISILLQHETNRPTACKVESSHDILSQQKFVVGEDTEFMDSEDEDEEVPLVSVGGLKIPVTEVDNKQIAKMTPAEKDVYIQAYQNYYSIFE